MEKEKLSQREFIEAMTMTEVIRGMTKIDDLVKQKLALGYSILEEEGLPLTRDSIHAYSCLFCAGHQAGYKASEKAVRDHLLPGIKW